MNLLPIFLFAIAVAVLGFGLVYSPTANAVECVVLPQPICNLANDGGTTGGVFYLLRWILNIMIGLVGVAAVGGVIWAGILYLTASEDTSKVKQAKTIIVDVAIGLVAFGLMFLVLNWLIPGGVIK